MSELPKVTRMNRSSNWEWLCTGGDYKVADDGVVVSYWDYKCLEEETARLKAENDKLKQFAKILYHDSEVWIPKEARIAIGIESPVSPKRPAGGSGEAGGMDGQTDQSKRL